MKTIMYDEKFTLELNISKPNADNFAQQLEKLGFKVDYFPSKIDAGFMKVYVYKVTAVHMTKLNKILFDL